MRCHVSHTLNGRTSATRSTRIGRRMPSVGCRCVMVSLSSEDHIDAYRPDHIDARTTSRWYDCPRVDIAASTPAGMWPPQPSYSELTLTVGSTGTPTVGSLNSVPKTADNMRKECLTRALRYIKWHEAFACSTRAENEATDFLVLAAP